MASSTPRLGELLRLVHLATAPHVDPFVLNALWDDDEICAMGLALCARCDGVDRRRVAPTVTLDIVRHWQPSGRSGVGLVYDALYAWDEATASTEFLRLRDALGSCTSDRPPTQVALVLAFLKQDCDTTRRDLQTLLARSRDPGREDGGQFPLARVFAHSDAVQVRSPHYAPILTTLVDSGMCSRLPLNAHYDSTLTPEESAHM